MSLPPSLQLEPDELHALQRVSPARHRNRLLTLLGLYLLGAAGAVVLAGRWAGVTGLFLQALLSLLAAASLHGLSLFTHEGVHGALARSPAWNRALAVACALPVLQNFAAYRVLHLRHHADLGGARDPDHYANYASRPWLVQAMNWGRLLLGYPAYITAIPVLGWRQGSWRERAWIALELGCAALLVVSLTAGKLPAAVVIHGWLIPMVIINTLVNVRGMSQHTLLPESADALRGTRTILAGPVVRFFMCNENFHLEHHLYPRVPWHNLPALHARLHQALLAERAPFIPSYFSFVRLFLGASWRPPSEVEARGHGSAFQPAPDPATGRGVDAGHP